MPHYNYNEVAIIDIVALCNVKPPADATKWLNDNKKYQVIMSPYPTATHFAYNISILTSAAQLNWLKEASGFIDYKNNYAFIEALHEIPKGSEFKDLIEGEISNGNSLSYTLSDILKELKLIGYQAYNYEKYMSFKFDAVAKKMSFKLVDNDNKMTDYCFSFPFFRSMIESKKINDLTQCQLDFIEFPLPDGNTLLFKLNFNNGTAVGYYDYSHNPPLRTGSVFFNFDKELVPLYESHKINF